MVFSKKWYQKSYLLVHEWEFFMKVSTSSNNLEIKGDILYFLYHICSYPLLHFPLLEEQIPYFQYKAPFPQLSLPHFLLLFFYTQFEQYYTLVVHCNIEKEQHKNWSYCII